jgi:hypothetical protein
VVSAVLGESCAVQVSLPGFGVARHPAAARQAPQAIQTWRALFTHCENCRPCLVPHRKSMVWRQITKSRYY